MVEVFRLCFVRMKGLVPLSVSTSSMAWSSPKWHAQAVQRASRQRIIGWALVAVQAVLLVALIALGGGEAWPTPTWLRSASTALVVVGLVVIAAAATGLGRLLTPTPVPKADGSLVTDGLYRFVRHPIYSGVLVVAVGLVLPSGNPVTLVVGVATIAFFYAKSSWEEARLAEEYPDYDEYRARTPRFMPRLPH